MAIVVSPFYQSRMIFPLALVAVLSGVFGDGYLAHAAEKVRIFDAKKNKWVETIRSPDAANDAVSGAVDRRPERSVVAYPNQYAAGTIIIETQSRQLFQILNKQEAMRYAIGVGREGFTWKGRERVSSKKLWPTWTPPAEMRRREAEKGRILPARMEGGPDNPLGARAMYLGNTLYRIHGTNQPWSVGEADSSGCIRLDNDDVIHLFENTKIGTLVIVR